MPTCVCGNEYLDGSGLRDHIREEHPNLVGIPIDDLEGVSMRRVENRCGVSIDGPPRTDYVG